METLTSVALARELNVILRDTFVTGAEQAEGNTLLLHLRPSSAGASRLHASRNPKGDSGPGYSSEEPTVSPMPTSSPVWLVLSSCLGESTLFVTKRKPEYPGTTWPAPISRYLERARIESVAHNGLERVLSISLIKTTGSAGKNEDPSPKNRKEGHGVLGKRGTIPFGRNETRAQCERDRNLILHIELVTGRPRAILTGGETGLVVEAFPSRRGAGGRTFIPGERYQMPARPNDKLDPWSLEVPVLDSALGSNPSVGDVVRCLFGVGRDLARELAARCGDTGKTFAAELKDLISSATEGRARGYLVTAPEQPARETSEQEPADTEIRRTTPPRVVTYRPSTERPLQVAEFTTVNEALRKAFVMCRRIAFEQGRRRGATKEIRTQLRRIARTRRALDLELEEAKGAADVRRRGELILAHMAGISKGQKAVDLPGPEGGRSQMARIKLETHLTAAENAAAYFRKAKKLEKKLSSLPERIEKLSRRESRLQEKLEGAISGPLPSGAAKKPKTSPRTGSKPDRWPTGISPRQFRSFDGWTMYVGRNNKENDYITFSLARPDDFWFHAQGMTGSHVILRREGRKSRPSKKCLEETASVAAHFSKGRTSQTVPVIFTEKKYVRKPRKAKPGMALYSHEKTLLVSPRLPHSD